MNINHILTIIISVNKNKGKMQMLSLNKTFVIEFSNLWLLKELNKILFDIFNDDCDDLFFQNILYLFKYDINRL